MEREIVTRPGSTLTRTAALAACAVLTALAAGCGGATKEPSGPALRPAAVPPAPAPATRARDGFLVARVRHTVDWSAHPGGKVSGRLKPKTEFGSARVLGVVRRRGPWLGTIAPERPNGKLAWVRADAVELQRVPRSLHIDLSKRRLELLQAGRVLLRATIAVGRPETPTPAGRYAVTDLLRTAVAGSPYGCCALALSGHQPNLPPGWPGGDRIAIHGTPVLASIGQAASFGCLRMTNANARRLLSDVRVGTPVFVRA
jgi:lipoprotein-anchoring transpeptidase ErfK/SrfK